MTVTVSANTPARRCSAPAVAPLLGCLLLGACASADVTETGGVYDPFEPVNRAVFDANLVADDYVIRPVAEAYGTVVPEPVRDRIRNVLRNMRQPIVFANEVLQGDWEGAEVAFTRFFINSTVGLGGLHDVAGMDKRLAFRNEDFGQTLAVWGVDEGPYLVLPFLGPSNARDLGGFAVDIAADPIRWATGPIGDVDAFGPSRTGATLIDTRERTIEPLDDLRENSIDYYAALRSSYQQFRQGEIADGEAPAALDIPDFDFQDTEASDASDPSGTQTDDQLSAAADGSDLTATRLGPSNAAAPTAVPQSEDAVSVERRRSGFSGFLQDIGVRR